MIDKLAVLLLIFGGAVTAVAQTQVNPASQINWPVITGTTAPTQYCPTATTGSIVSGSASVTLASTSGVFTNQVVVGTGIPTATSVTAINSTTRVVTLSQAATATTSSVTLSFSSYGMPYTNLATGAVYSCTPSGWVQSGSGAYLPLSGGTLTGTLNGTSASFSGTVVAGATNGQINAAMQQSPPGTGNNGIQMSLLQCLSNTYACSILAPALYAQTEAQPWGLGDTLTNGIPVIGPEATDPKGCVTDDRWGTPQVICNQGLTTGTSGRFVGSSPLFAQAITTFGNGLSTHAPSALNLQYSVFGGSRDFGPGDESNMYVVTANEWVHSSGNQNLFNGTINGYAPGDSIPVNMSAWSVGQSLAQNEGLEWRARLGENGNVEQGMLNTKTCSNPGTCLLSLSQTQGIAGGWGNDLPMIDITQAYNSGYVASRSQGTFTGSGTNWNSTYGATTATTTTTAAVSNTSGGNPTLNTFPQSNVTISLTNSTGFSTGQTACMFDSIDPSWQCSHITAVPDGTHITVDVMNYPLSNGSTIAAGGLTGYGFGMDADWVVPGALNGYTVSGESPLTGIVRQVYPIVSNTSGDTLEIYAYGNGSPNVNAGIISRSYSSAAGSGGTGSVTVSGGAVTACLASGGSGYITNSPPSIQITGITSTSAPMVYPTVSSGALSGCTVLYAGAGIAGTPVVTVNPNPYHIYPQGRTLSVYNGATGAVDGSAVVTTPVVGTFATGDTLEQPHYFRIKVDGMNFAFNNYQEGGEHSNINFSTFGNFGSNNYEGSYANNNDPTLYASYPALTTPMPGRGQWTTPDGFYLQGPHRTGIRMSLPPYGAGGTRTGAVVVSCGTVAQCQAWNNFYPVLNMQGWNTTNSRQAEDVLQYNPVTQTIALTSGATNGGGTSPGCTYTWSPTGFSYTGTSCSSVGPSSYLLSQTSQQSIVGALSTYGNAVTTSWNAYAPRPQWMQWVPTSATTWMPTGWAANTNGDFEILQNAASLPSNQPYQVVGSQSWIFKNNTTNAALNYSYNLSIPNLPSNSSATFPISGQIAVQPGAAGSQAFGYATLASGTVTISNGAACTASATCIYKLTNCGTNSSAALGLLTIGTVTAGTSFVINSESAAVALVATDNSHVCWEIN